ncbi:MAG TPA: HD-GYP domain-containing protein [Gaiellaceae bacterium]|nr:HD-GYP domain-containing protein [Gaiellaceae bacterium]
MTRPESTGRRAKRRKLERSLTLLQRFLLASAAILVAGAVVLGWVLTQALHSQALDSERASLARYVDSVVRPTLVSGDRVVLTRRGDAALLSTLRAQPDVVTVKVWRPDGTLAWTNRDRSRIGRRFPLDTELGEAIRENQPVADIVGTGGEGENAVEKRLGFSHLFQVYAPIESADRTHAIGAYEIYADPAAVDRLIGSRRHMIWVAVAVIFLALYAALTLLVRGASRTLRRQNDALRERSERLLESYRRLEESALEAVETLNATVDAKDPYTAGHSQRVQRVALAVGAELGIGPAGLDALRFAGLFHDLGKLRVPDAILTKPEPLTPEEYEVIKRHPEDGAAIVGRLGRLREAVPLIRHHHERWDGSGYPDGLAGGDIPLEAAVVGLADAWDAMTSDRPYSRARSLEDAAEEIRRGRGTQFAPAVVDAFFAALRRDPAAFAPETELVEASAS